MTTQDLIFADECVRCPECDGLIDITKSTMPCIECGKEYGKE